MEELRKALNEKIDPEERKESDARSLDGFVDDRKGQISAFEDNLARDLDAVAGSIEDKLDAKMRSVEEDFNARMEAAVAGLRQNAQGGALDPSTSSAAQKAAAEAAAAAAAEADGGVLSARLPNDALIVVAGASTPLGAKLVRALGGCGAGFKLRALITEGSKLDAGAAKSVPECEEVALAPFAPTALSKSLSGAEALVVVTAGASGKGGIEPEVVPKLMKAVGPGLRRIVMVSTHGVERVDQLPFSLQNAMGGKLDKQRAAEQEVVLAARKCVPSFSLMRIGKLKDDGDALPASTYEGPPKSRAELAAGDKLSGELPMSTAAAVVVQTLRRAESVNATFSLGEPGSASKSGLFGGVSGPALTSDEAHWDDQFLKLVGPEVYRRGLASLSPDEAQTWLREWARRFLRPGNKLTTPVTVQDTDDGVLLRFLTIATGYADFDVDETADEKWAATKPGAMEAKAGKPDGALLLTAEGRPHPRIRVSRAEMGENTVVKEMSETSVLQRLDKDLDMLEKNK